MHGLNLARVTQGFTAFTRQNLNRICFNSGVEPKFTPCEYKALLWWFAKLTFSFMRDLVLHSTEYDIFFTLHNDERSPVLSSSVFLSARQFELSGETREFRKLVEKVRRLGGEDWLGLLNEIQNKKKVLSFLRWILTPRFQTRSWFLSLIKPGLLREIGRPGATSLAIRRMHFLLWSLQTFSLQHERASFYNRSSLMLGETYRLQNLPCAGCPVSTSFM